METLASTEKKIYPQMSIFTITNIILTQINVNPQSGVCSCQIRTALRPSTTTSTTSSITLI